MRLTKYGARLLVNSSRLHHSSIVALYCIQEEWSNKHHHQQTWSYHRVDPYILDMSTLFSTNVSSTMAAPQITGLCIQIIFVRTCKRASGWQFGIACEAGQNTLSVSKDCWMIQRGNITILACSLAASLVNPTWWVSKRSQMANNQHHWPHVKA